MKNFSSVSSLLCALSELCSLFLGLEIAVCTVLLVHFYHFLSSHVVLFRDTSMWLLLGRDNDKSGLPLGFNIRAAWLAGMQSTAVKPPDAGLRACEFLSGSSGLQLGVASSTPLSSSVLRPRGLGLEMLEPHHPSHNPPTPGANVAPSGGGGSGGSAGYFAAVLEGLHGPLIVCLSFRPSEHVMSPLARVCFFFLSAFLAAGGSHTSHLAVDCCLVPGRLSCTRACERPQTCTANFMFSAYSFPQGEC